MNDIFIEVANCILQKKAGVLCLITSTCGSTPRKAGSRMIVWPDGSVTGSIGGGATEKEVIQISLGIIDTDSPLMLHFDLTPANGQECGGSLDIYLEPVGRVSRVLIFGAGHIGREVARLAKQFNFIPILIDNRPGFTSQKNLSEFECIEGEYSVIINNLQLGMHDYCLVCTHQHTFDIEVTAALAPYPLAFLGMIGSQRKIATAKQRFTTEFGLSEAQIASINMPVGLPFVAETPEEIALSIVGGLIDVRNKKKGLK
ncbi:MAG: XdhC/CoxI family protein [Bacteroidales bacterium]|nr:XdhC/CoxI family protein [Bacteroidales bacterium]